MRGYPSFKPSNRINKKNNINYFVKNIFKLYINLKLYYIFIFLILKKVIKKRAIELFSLYSIIFIRVNFLPSFRHQ